jgi:hypothetical protein
VGAVLVVVPLVLTQRLPRMGLIPEWRAAQQIAAKVLAPADTISGKRLISATWPSILGSSYPIAREHTNRASLLRTGTQVPLGHGITPRRRFCCGVIHLFGRFWHTRTPIQR